MIKYYCGIPEECNPEQARSFDIYLKRIGIKIVFMHAECMLSEKLEKTEQEIEEDERRDPTGSNFPLQPNCLYAYTPLDGLPMPSRHPIVRLLEKKPAKVLHESNTVFLNCTLPQEKDYKDLTLDVYKNIQFLDEATRKEVGWYNKTTNILWMSDIFHYYDSAKSIIPAIVEAVTGYTKYGKIPEILTLGADPEFEVVDCDNNFVEAHMLFPDREGAKEIGCDAVSSTGELRPKPDKHPLGLTRNIKRLIRKLNNLHCMGNNKVWVGGGINVTTGGHVHFGMKGVTPELKDLLYDMVAAPVLAFQSDKRKNGEGNNWMKGQSGNTRDQPHGTEWRPLPSFIVNERVTAAILSTAYAIAKSWKYKGHTDTVRPITVESYRKLPLYGAFKDQIDTFIRLFITKEDKVVLHKKDIFSEWKTERIKKAYTVDILSQAEWIQQYFAPLNVKLAKPVKLEIRFSGDTISVFGLKPEEVEKLAAFADKHYLPTVIVNALPKGQSRPIISLPSQWYHMTGKAKFCEEFKSVLKDMILTLGGKS